MANSAPTSTEEPTCPTSASTSTPTTKSAMLVQLTTDGIPKLHCPACDKTLVSLNGYVKHLKKHEPPGGFLCRYCDQRFCFEDALKKHRTEVHTLIACRLCKEVTFTNENDYREHIRIIHDGVDRQMFKCDKCGAEYKTLYPFKRHMATECGKIKLHKCEQCDLSFVTKYNLKQHIELHSDERKFCCSYCGKDFKQKGRLLEHERTHTGEKPHKCDICGKCFAQRESIVTHYSLHTGVRAIECKCCQARFSCHSNLIKHRRNRPQTCGLPEYDTPKQRTRTHRPRIPATLNPTTEIRVSNSNRIIKPDHREQQKRRTGVKEKKEKPLKPGAQKRTSKKSKRRRKVSTSTDTTEEGNVIEDSDDDDETGSPLESIITIEPELQIQQNNVFTNAADSDDDEEDNPDMDPDESDSENERKEDVKASIAKVARIKSENYGKKKVGEVTYGDDDLEFIDSHQFDTENGVKSEEMESVFNAKDKLLCLLKEEDDNADEDDIESKSSSKRKAIKQEQASLDETEMILVKNEQDVNYVEEVDILDINNKSTDTLDPCKILLNDVCEHFPSLKDNASVNIANDALTQTRRKRNAGKRRSRIKATSDNLDETPREGEKCVYKKKKTNANADDDDEVPRKKKRSRKPRTNDESQNNATADVGDEVPRKKKRSRKPRTNAESQNNATADDGNEVPRKKRRSRKPRTNDESQKTTTGAMRLAKITNKELKERLKLLNRSLGKPYQCPHCVKIYYIRGPFERHLRIDHERSEEEIQQCLAPEQAILKDGEAFKCHICGKIYLMEKRLKYHITLHGPDGKWVHKCPCFCATYFATKEEATAHAQKEHRNLIHCNICDKFMRCHDSLRGHMKKHAADKTGEMKRLTAQRNLVCDKCGKKFAGRTTLNDHVRSDCGRNPIYQCNICGKSLTTAGILKTHLLTHKDDTPYQCEHCGKPFKVKAQYKAHLKIMHTDDKPYQCHLCPRAYAYRESLLTHMTVHTGIKRFLCNGCGKRFTCVSNLQAHRKVHSETCGQLPLNAKATQYMGVQKGNLLLGGKPEAGVDYKETNTLLAKEVIDRDHPLAHDINCPSEPSTPLVTVPLSFSRTTVQSYLMSQGTEGGAQQYDSGMQ